MAEEVAGNQKKEFGLEEYKKYVRSRLKAISSIFESISLGDFSVKIEIPEEEDEFTELLVGLNLMIEDMREFMKAKEEIAIALVAVERARLEEEEKARKVIEARVRELEDFRRAMIHILEDMDRTNRELRRAYKELKALSRMKDEFLSMTSHELKTPLTPIRSFLQLMESGKLDNFRPGKAPRRFNR
jgi:signal transduction histidine kinase